MVARWHLARAISSYNRKAILKFVIVYSSHGDRPQAIGFYTKALDLAKEAGDLAGEKIAEERLQKSHLDLGVVGVHTFFFILFLLLL